MIILKARFGVKGKPGRGLEEGCMWSRTETMGTESYTVSKKERRSLEVAKVREGVWKGHLKMEGRACQAEGATEAKA